MARIVGVIVARIRGIQRRLHLDEAAPVVLLAAISLLAWAFTKVALEVAEGETATVDRVILLALRNPADFSDPIGPSWFEEAARDITALGGPVVLGLLTGAVIVHLLLSRKRGAALFVLGAIGGGALVSTVLKLGFERSRPDLVPHGTVVYTASFPSGHAMLSAITYLTLGVLLARVEKDRRVRVFYIGSAILLTAMVGASRVYLGVHWPTDVLAGWCGGTAWASICWFIALRLQRRGAVEPAA